MITTEDLCKAGSDVVCVDGTLSHAGGLQGACSHHGGISAMSVRTAASSAPSHIVRIPARGTRELLRSAPARAAARIPAFSTRDRWLIGAAVTVVVVAGVLKLWRDDQEPE
jgi:hypothetical protein